MKKILFAGVLLLLIIIATSSDVKHALTEAALSTGWFDSPPPTEIRGPLLSDSALNHPFVTIHGESVRLADFEGNVVLLTYWASWCGTCRRTNPTIQTLSRELSSRDDVTFLLVSMDNVRESALKYMETNRISIPNVFSDDIPPAPLNSPSIPTTYVIDKNGRIVFRETGYSNFSRRNFKEWIVGVADRES